MAHIDLDNVGVALDRIRSTKEGVNALGEFRTNMDKFVENLGVPLVHSERVFLFRTLMADLSIDDLAGIPNAGDIVDGDNAVGGLGDAPVVNVHGFSVSTQK